MKMHTFFLSGKAIAIVSGAFGACGMLLFVSGVLVGVRVQAHAPEARVTVPALPAAPALPTAGTSTSSSAVPAPAATTGTTSADANVAAANQPADAAWPFNASSYTQQPLAPATQTEPVSAPVVPAPAPATPAPVAPQPTRRGVAGTAGTVSMIAYVAPNQSSDVAAIPAPARPARDDAEYLVQVGMFRVEQHARELADRLEKAGYRSSITVRQEGDKSLHVVRVGRFTGIDAAEKAAAKIGGSEQLVASVVVAKQ